MSIKSGVFAAITTIALVLVLGNEWMIRQSLKGSFSDRTRGSISGRLRWQVWDVRPDDRGALVIGLVVLVVLVAVLGAIVGRARPLAAFFGGWGVFLAASVVGAGAYGLLLDDRFLGPGEDPLDTFSAAASGGTATGIWLGWLVGLAIMLGSLGADRKGRSAPPSPPPGAWGGEPAPAPPGAWGAGPANDPHQPAASPFGSERAAPSSPAPPPPPAAPSGDGPVIGTPPDRTQVFGEPPTH